MSHSNPGFQVIFLVSMQHILMFMATCETVLKVFFFFFSFYDVYLQYVCFKTLKMPMHSVKADLHNVPYSFYNFCFETSKDYSFPCLDITGKLSLFT